ncbi:MAG: hypothetical protein OEY49_01565 [Candidatus Heimdallarchaeota archaeon]|nr:hypothetical protein [Candidatus Heimdallarchaeota archaeon]
MKKPILSALFNMILPGIGYFYNGQRIILGLLIPGFLVIINFAQSKSNNPNFPTAITSYIFIGLISAIDGYFEAKKINNTRSQILNMLKNNKNPTS